MIPVVCFWSFLFGNWPLKWDGENGIFKTNYYFVLPSCFMFGNIVYLLYTLLCNSNATNPQYLILYTLYFNYIILILNRLANVRHGGYFVNELKRTFDLTVESGRNLLEFCFRISILALTVYNEQPKYVRSSGMTSYANLVRFTVPQTCCICVGTTMECQYAAACRALTDRLAAVNRRSGSWGSAAGSLAAAARDHRRLVRLVRLFNEEYGVPVFLTTVNLLLKQIYVMNDTVSGFFGSDTAKPADGEIAYVRNAIVWTESWFRLWWICYRMDCLTGQVHLTAKLLLENDINSFPENTRKLAFEFLDQLLHRHVRISAWGFYDVNKGLLSMILGYQFGLCLICNQFTTSGTQPTNTTATGIQNNTSR